MTNTIIIVIRYINYRSPLVLPSAVSLQLFLCNISPVCDFTSTIAAGAAEIALDLRYNTKQVNYNYKLIIIIN